MNNVSGTAPVKSWGLRIVIAIGAIAVSFALVRMRGVILRIVESWPGSWIALCVGLHFPWNFMQSGVFPSAVSAGAV
jgi:hypothetical protein